MTESEWQTRKQRVDTRLRSPDPTWQIIRHREGLDRSTLLSHAGGQPENIVAKVHGAMRDIGRHGAHAQCLT